MIRQAALSLATLAIPAAVLIGAVAAQEPGREVSETYVYLPLGLRNASPQSAPTVTPGPSHYHLLSVDMVSADDGWAVGASADALGTTILHWDGRAWEEIDSPEADGLLSVSMVSATDGWAVGSNILHWDGTSWSQVSPYFDGYAGSPAVSMASADYGWAVGNRDYLYRWNGDAWWGVANPIPTRSLYDVEVVSETDAWAVGHPGAFIHWDGEGWTEVDCPVEDSLLSVDFVAADDGWAVGAGGTVLRYDGESWTEAGSPTDKTLLTVSMVSADDGWAMGQTILRWDGVSWIEQPLPSDDAVVSMDMVSSNVGWAVGYNDTLLRWDGREWAVVEPPVPPSGPTRRPTRTATPERPNLMSVSMASATDGWAVGEKGTVLRSDGAQWERQVFPSGHHLVSVDVVSSDDVWAVSNQGSTHHWDGTRWQSQPPPLDGTDAVDMFLTSVDMVSADDGWAVGGMNVGSRLNPEYVCAVVHWDGEVWQAERCPGEFTLRDVDMVSSAEGWAVGLGGAVLRWNGVEWLVYDGPADHYDALEDVAMVSETVGWAVPIMFHEPFSSNSRYDMLTWDGSEWSLTQGAMSPAGSTALYAVDFASSDDGWAVGDWGMIVRWDGKVWSQILADVSGTLRGIDMAAADAGWAVGDSGTIMHWDGLMWSEPSVSW